MRGTQAGFSLIEILIAAALFVVVTFAALESVRVLLPAARQLGARHLAYAGLERLSSQMRAEARSAVAVWPSAPAKTGAHDDCDEVSFYTADAAGPKFWSYRRFPNHTAAEAVPGNALLRVTGTSQPPPCNPSATAQTVASGVSAFTVVRVAAPQLAAHADPYSGVADGGFVTGTLDDDKVPIGVDDASGAGVQGGNAVVEVRIDTADASRAVDLAAGIAPGGFTTVLAYTCNARCAVGHGSTGAQTITTCTATWTTLWNPPVAIYGGPYSSGGVFYLQGPLLGYAWDGLFTFTYYDGAYGTGNSVQRTYEVTNWPGQPWTTPGHLTNFPTLPFPVNDLTSASQWYADITADLVGNQSALQTDFATCTAMSQTPANGLLRN